MTAISGPAIPGRRLPSVSTSATAVPHTRPPLRLTRPAPSARPGTADPRAVRATAVGTGRFQRAPFTYSIVPIDALLGTALPLDDARAQSRADRRAGAAALLFIAVTFVVATLIVGLAVAQLIHIAVTDFTLGPSHISR